MFTLFGSRELVFSHTAKWTFKIVRKFFKWSAWFDSCFRNTYCWIVFPATYITYVLLHKLLYFVG